GQNLRLRVPVGALVDPGLALDPSAVRLGNVVGTRGEDVEDQPAAGQEELPRRRERLAALAVAGQVEVGAEGAGDERDAPVDRRPEQLAEAEVEAGRGSGA